jgi:peroxiredoxin
MGLEFKAPEKYTGMLSERSNGQNNGLLPVPSLFVVDTSGKILFEYINPDYKMRISPGLLLAVLKELKKDLK